MTEIAALTTVIGVVGGLAAIIFGYATYKRNQKTDDSNEGKETGTLFTEIGYIKSGIDDIKRKQEKQDERYTDMVERLSTVEASAKQAHLRINRLEGHNGREER
jgi:hypothetical protein